MTLRVGVVGASGRIGRLVLDEIALHADLRVAWTCTRTLPDDPNADVIVDFSTPALLCELLERTGSPVVSGTTGVPPSTLDSGAARFPFLHSPNFSPGIAVLCSLVQHAARALPGYDVEIVEIHHNQKRDAPSGTALRLAEGLGPIATGHAGLREPGSVGIHAIRGGDILGEHTVYLAGPGERLQLAHITTDRRVFAAGALRAARWLVRQPAGRYTLADVLGGTLGIAEPDRAG